MQQSQSKLFRTLPLTILKIQILLQQFIFPISNNLKIIILALGQLQMISLIQNSEQNNLNIINTLKYFIRPDLLLLDQRFLFLFGLLSFIVFDGLLLNYLVIDYIRRKKNEHNIKLELCTQSNSTIQFIVNMSSLYSQIYHIYLYIPIQFLSLNSLKLGLREKDILIISLSIISIIFQEISSIFRLAVSTTSISMKIQGFGIIEINKVYILKYILIRITLIINAILEEDGNIIVGIACMMISTLIILSILTGYVQPIFNFCVIKIITQSFSFVYVICFLINQIGIIYLIFPIAANIFINIYKYQIDSIWMSATMKTKTIPQIKYYLSLKINQQITYKDDIFVIQQAYLILIHRQKCKDLHCFCQHIGYIDDPKRVVFLTDKMMQRIIMIKLSYWNKQMNHSDDIDYIHYISTLDQYGFTTQAFQECNRILHQNQSSKYRGFITKSETSLHSEQLSKRSGSSSSQLSAKYKNKISKLKIREQSLSQANQQKLKILLSDIRANLQRSFQFSQNKSQEDMAIGIDLFMQSELKNDDIKQNVIKIIRQKIFFFQMILNNQQLKAAQLFRQSKQISSALMILENNLMQQYQAFPSQKLQSINCFIQAEILNNYLKAFKIQNLSTISDEKLLNMKKLIKVNLFGKNVVYLVLQLSENLQSMKIIKSSNQPHQFFGYKQEEFNKQQSIDFLLPDFIYREHGLLVHNFIINGKSKYYRNMEISFLKTPSGLIRAFNLYFDLYLGKTDDLSFTAFFEEAVSPNGYILVDVNGNIGGVNEKLFEKAGWKQSEIKQYAATLHQAYSIPINYMIPTFDELVMSKLPINKIYGVTLQMFSKNMLDNNNSSVTQRFSKDNWTLASNQNQYSSTIVINCNELFGFHYYVIEVEDMRFAAQTKTFSEPNNEDDHFNFSQIDESEIEAEIQQPQQFNFIFDKQNTFDSPNHKINVEQSYYVKAAPDLEQSYNNRIVPDQSMRKLIDSSKSAQKQMFFNHNESQYQEKSQSKISDLVQSNQRNVNQFYDVDLEQIDKEMRENIRMQLQLDRDKQNDENEQVDDRASQVSSLIGVRKSVFFKKYDIIQRIIARDRKPTVLFLSNALITAFFAMTFLHCVIVLSNTSTDFSRFLQEIDMLLFHSSFMTPFDMFLALRLQSSNYNNQLRLKIITQQEYDPLNKWLFSQFGYGYEQMQVNFIEQMSNPFIQEFFTDDNMLVKFQKANSSDIYEVDLNFKESLFVLLNYQFRFKVAYDLGESLSNRPFLTYSYANYFNLHDKFEGMTLKILNYTKLRKIQVDEKWISIWVPFMILSTIIVLAQYFIYLKYIQRYEFYLDLFRFADQNFIERDLERYKILLNFLAQDSDVMFKYQYDLEQKEKFMMAEKYKNESKQKSHDNAKKKGILKQPKLSKEYSLLFSSFLLAIYFTISFLIQIQTSSYLTKYVVTADIYKLTGDLNFCVPGLFSQRQVAFFWQGFSYFNDTDRDRLMNRINNDLDVLIKFNEILQNFQENVYLTNQQFMQVISSIKSGDVCSFLTQEIHQVLDIYCSKSFDGSLELGLTQSLNFIKNSIITEMSLNNFTSQITYNQYEVEGAFILVRVIQQIVQQFKDGMITSTQDHISLLNGLAILYMIFGVFAILVQYGIVWIYVDKEYYLVKRFLLLLPSQTLLLDDNFERRVRLLQAIF